MTEVAVAEPQKLLAIHTLLRLIHHRNKNQHRKSKWWKWLSTLNRTVWKLVQAVEAEQSSPGITQSASLSVERYKEYLAVHTIPRCYL